MGNHHTVQQQPQSNIRKIRTEEVSVSPQPVIPPTKKPDNNINQGLSEEAKTLFKQFLEADVKALGDANNLKPTITDLAENVKSVSMLPFRYNKIFENVLVKNDKLCLEEKRLPQTNDAITLKILDYCIGKDTDGKEVLKFNHNINRVITSVGKDTLENLIKENTLIPSENVIKFANVSTSVTKTPVEVLDIILGNATALLGQEGIKVKRVSNGNPLISSIIVDSGNNIPLLHLNVDALSAVYNPEICGQKYKDNVSIREKIRLNEYCIDKDGKLFMNVIKIRDDIGTTFSDVVPIISTKTVSNAAYDAFVNSISKGTKPVYYGYRWNYPRSIYPGSCFGCSGGLLPSLFVPPPVVSLPPLVTISTPLVATPVVTTPLVTGSIVTNPVVTSPIVTTPYVTSPIVTSPIVTSPIVSSPVIQYPPIVTYPRTYYIKNRHTEDSNETYASRNMESLNSKTLQNKLISTKVENKKVSQYEIQQLSAEALENECSQKELKRLDCEFDLTVKQYDDSEEIQKYRKGVL
jgi:hypothetical protein